MLFGNYRGIDIQVDYDGIFWATIREIRYTGETIKSLRKKIDISIKSNFVPYIAYLRNGRGEITLHTIEIVERKARTLGGSISEEYYFKYPDTKMEAQITWAERIIPKNFDTDHAKEEYDSISAKINKLRDDLKNLLDTRNKLVLGLKSMIEYAQQKKEI